MKNLPVQTSLDCPRLAKKLSLLNSSISADNAWAYIVKIKEKQDGLFYYAGGAVFSDLAVSGLQKADEKTRGIVRNQLQNSVLVDLGSGHVRNSVEFVRSLVEAGFPPKAYFGVELYVYSDYELTNSRIDCTYVEASMLSFLNIIEPGKASFTINGVDESVIADYKSSSRAGNLIVEKLGSGNVVFGAGVHSRIEEIFDQNLITLCKDGQFFCYQKQ